MRGGEKVVEALGELYPQADIFTHVVDPDKISDALKRHVIRTSLISRLPRARSWYKRYLPLMPLALEQLDLRPYDLVLSSESGPAKGIIPKPDALHLCYCHSPMRYIWNMYHDYRDSAGPATRLGMSLFAHYLRLWDESSAARVDHFVANSNAVARRIEKYYRRQASVIHPPVSTDAFAPVGAAERGDYYLMVGELVAYKRPDLAVQAFNASGRPLIVIGGGEMLGELRRIARPNVQLLGAQPLERLQHHYARCRALIFPGEEDFGIVPVEAMASGRPVIAYGAGGALDTVIEGRTGFLFAEPGIGALNAAIERFEAAPLDAALIRTHSEKFSRARFKAQMQALIELKLEEQRAHGGRPVASVEVDGHDGLRPLDGVPALLAKTTQGAGGGA